MIKTYRKLVRDRIPELIEKQGGSCTVEILPLKNHHLPYPSCRFHRYFPAHSRITAFISSICFSISFASAIWQRLRTRLCSG